ncbi:MAG: hypothetical protein ONB23_02590 [candidate division KSB1 bacterium]|nr:hypothetical protein [candidate division KSB1 bacterium]
MIERTVTIGYLLGALTIAYYPARGRRATVYPEEVGLLGRWEAPTLALPALIGTPALFLLAGAAVTGWQVIAILLLSSVASALILLPLLAEFQDQGHNPSFPLILGLRDGVSLLLAAGRFVVFAVLGGSLLAAALGFHPALASVLFVVTVGLMTLPVGRAASARVDLLHALLVAVAALCVLGAQARLPGAGMEVPDSVSALQGSGLLFFFLAAILLSVWFWSDDAYIRAFRAGSVRVQGRGLRLSGAQLALVIVLGPALVRITPVAVQGGPVLFSDATAVVRAAVVLMALCGVLSGMSASLRAMLFAGAQLAGGARSGQGAEGQAEPLRAQLAALAVLVAMLPIVQLAAKRPGAAAGLVASMVAVLVPPVAAVRWTEVLRPGLSVWGCRFALGIGLLLGCSHVIARYGLGTTPVFSSPVLTQWHLFVPISVAATAAGAVVYGHLSRLSLPRGLKQRGLGRVSR